MVRNLMKQKLYCFWHLVCLCVITSFPRKSPFPTYSEIHRPAHQWKGQLHLTGTWFHFGSFLIKTAADPISRLVFFFFLFAPVQFSSNLLGSFVIPVGSHSRLRISPHNAFIPHNEIMRPSWASCINTETNPIKTTMYCSWMFIGAYYTLTGTVHTHF